MSKTKNREAAPDPEVFTNFTLTLENNEVHTIPVVPTIDDLPRAAKRRLRAVLTDSATEQMITNGPRYQLAVDYAVAYAGVQGVHVNLDAIEDDAVFDRVRMELVTAGLRLIGHFNSVGDAGKADDATPTVPES